MSRAIEGLIGAPAKIRKHRMLSYKTSKRLVPLFYVAPATFLFSLVKYFFTTRRTSAAVTA